MQDRYLRVMVGLPRDSRAEFCDFARSQIGSLKEMQATGPGFLWGWICFDRRGIFSKRSFAVTLTEVFVGSGTGEAALAWRSGSETFKSAHNGSALIAAFEIRRLMRFGTPSVRPGKVSVRTVVSGEHRRYDSSA